MKQPLLLLKPTQFALGLRDFWSAMHESRWYRSLAWAQRHAGAYEKTDLAFSEFKWADFLRKELAIEHGDEGFAKALTAARDLARSPKAAHLPGFLAK